MSLNEQVLSYPIPADAALEPPAEWAELRGKCPVAHVTLPSGDRATLLTRYADVKQVLADPRFTRQLNAPDAARLSAEGGGVFNSEIATIIPDGGEEHQHWRRLVGKWFTAKRMTALRPSMTEIADQLIDDMVKRGLPGDLRAGLGFPLPVYVICDMLGVPAEDRDRFSYWSDTLLNLTRYGKAEIDAAQGEFFQYMSDHVAAKRSEPGEDLLSELIAAGGPEDGGLADIQILVTGMALLVAGHETTANMIGKMVSMLLADRSRWEALLADPSLIRTAVEESLRLDANSGFGLPRYLREETEVSGTVLPRGTTVVCSMAAANRDESAFEAAAEMDLSRSPNPHLSFGSGAHSCLGQALARTELQVVLEVLLRKLPTLELAVPVEELERVEGLAVGGLRTVPVRW
ncbi:cytochrome P450 [Streptosporangium roseum]|uniref:Cytochrome P450 n=1 Tax=Streptosporangium roseum (strain ATCC 12428 / DSM 43021 / JCM 3005 / KCTC 9067 / NCIMB 10171 / NRRL 2505 / NI 9100) TaxID=479432 RepID=D2BC72_STRRD|nr:cytochrome P450 [Streptosporangium roseum]ACZ88095.1 putative cytochrome P450 [Streptosporangium roseum DSM 43021]